MSSSNFLIASHLFLKLLGLVYFFAFVPFITQIVPLIGSRGILPHARYLAAVKGRFGGERWRRLPSLFWLWESDLALRSAAIAGTICGLLLFFGVAPPLMLALLYLLYLSIFNSGQEFLSFGWELFLLEITVNAFFLSLSQQPNAMIWASLYLLLFRFHLQAGAVKFQSGDRTWRNLTALCYHYQTQPLPNTIAWYAHKLPPLFQKFSALFMFFVELAVPFFLLGSKEWLFAAYLLFAALQYAIWLTGNFSFLNYLTMALLTILLSDDYLSPLFALPEAPASSPLAAISLTGIGALLFALQFVRLWHHFLPNSLFSRLLAAAAPYFIGNRYGIFAVMTTKRYEIVIEGSDDGAEWKEYLFKYKPSELQRRPRRIAPLQPRLDWLAWFLPFAPYGNERWFQNLLLRLLQGEASVLSLFRENPFPSTPPRLIRALVYDYTFTTFAEKRATGRWWNRTLVGAYTPILSGEGHLSREDG